MSELLTDADKARFWLKAHDYGYCWEWTGSRNKDGYGTFRVYDACCLAHRVAYAIIRGRDLSDLDHIAHSCDNPNCVNPDHLFETDHQGNMTDSHIKGRYKVSKTGKSSQYIGVSWRNDSKKWRATIQVRKFKKGLGCFDDEIEAAKAYDAAMIEHFGDVLSPDSLNFPLPDPPEE